MTKSKRLVPLLLGILVALAAKDLAGAKKLDPESEKFYQTARLIMTKEETKIFRLLPDAESRKEFIADFWLKRDPDPDTPENEYKEEFDARVAFVAKRFNKEGGPAYNTDRGRVFIFMGPPDKMEEFPPMTNETSQGSVIWWSYYDDKMAVEFTDLKGTNQYRITSYQGDFLGAMDLFRLRYYVRADDVFNKKFLKFETVYHPDSKEIEVRLPAKGLMFRENDEGRLEVDLRFLIYVYSGEGAKKDTFTDARSVVVTDAELEALKTVDLRFLHALGPGTNYVDVVVTGKEGMKGKIRQIFEIKAPR